MKQHLFKIWFAALLCMACPGQSGAEMTRVCETAPLQERRFLSTAGVTETVRWKSQKAEKRKGIRGAGRKANRKGAIIAAIVLLSIGVIVFGGLGLIYLAVSLELAGDSLAIIGLILAIAGLLLGVLCAIGLFKQIRKLRQLKSQKNIERRPPTNIINQ